MVTKRAVDFFFSNLCIALTIKLTTAFKVKIGLLESV